MIINIIHKLTSYRALSFVLLLGHVTYIGLLIFWNTGVLKNLELIAYDQALRWQKPAPPDERIVLIGETETDIRRWGHPLSDEVLADALARLAQGQPRVIGVDKYRDLPVPPGSERLDQLIRHHPEIVWVMKFGNLDADELAIAPPAALADSDRIGFSDIPLDEDGLIRRGLLFLDDGRHSATAFALIVALRYLHAEQITPQPDPDQPNHLRLGATTIPPLAGNAGGYVDADTAGYQYLLDYRGQLNATQIYTLTDLLEGRLPKARLTDKIVLLGAMAESLRDEFQIPVRQFLAGTPPDSMLAGQGAGRIAGIALHALQINQLLRFALQGDAPLEGAPEAIEVGGLWLWCMAGVGLALCRLRFRWLLLLMASAVTLLIGLWQVAFLQHIWLPIVTPALGLTSAAALSTVYLSVYERAERQLLMTLFARHVAPEVADTLWRERQQFVKDGRLQPQRLIATVLFTDIRGFTTIVETLEPSQLMDWLNAYMESMAQAVMAHGGVIKQYVGDEVMALFGVPTPRQTEAEIAKDAQQAVRCALAMEERLRQLNADWAEHGLPTIAMRAGIHTGPLVAGSLGGKQRLEYAVVGDTVNTASRLESFGKNTHDITHNLCRILISETTLEQLSGQFRVTAMGRVKLKGKQLEISIYRIDGVINNDESSNESASEAVRQTQI